jgi:hypothetical protein
MNIDGPEFQEAICRHVLKEPVTGDDVVAAAEDTLERGHWCNEFCALVGRRAAPIEEVMPLFERGLRSLGRQLPSIEEALIGVGLWRSRQLLDGERSPEETARELGGLARAHGTDGGPLQEYERLDGAYWYLADNYQQTWEESKEARSQLDQATFAEAQRFLSEHLRGRPGLPCAT